MLSARRTAPLVLSLALLPLAVVPAAPAVAQQSPSDITVSATPSSSTAGQLVRVQLRGPANQPVELMAYSRPSSQYRTIRSGTFDGNGQVAWDVRPQTHTRFSVPERAGQARPSAAVAVRAALSLSASGSGKRYAFTGAVRPARGGVALTLYRVEASGRRVASGSFTTAADGTFRYVRDFTGTGRHSFVVQNRGDSVNAAGTSRSVAVTLGTAPAPSVLQLTADGVAGLRAGTSMASAESSLRQRFGAPTRDSRFSCEPSQATTRQLDYGSAVGVLFDVSAGSSPTLLGWHVRSGTAKHPVAVPYGVRVGTSLDEARRRIPDAQVDETIFGFLLTTERSPGLVWFLDGDSAPGPVVGITLNPPFCD